MTEFITRICQNCKANIDHRPKQARYCSRKCSKHVDYLRHKDVYCAASKKSKLGRVEFWKEYNRKYWKDNRKRLLRIAKRWRIRNKERVRELARESYRRRADKVKEYRLKVASTEIGKKKHSAVQMIYRRVKDGRIIKPKKCQKCGKVRKLDGHHQVVTRFGRGDRGIWHFACVSWSYA